MRSRAASQPQTIKNYTVSGYEKRPTPPGLLAVLQDYFERHKAEYTREVRRSAVLEVPRPARSCGPFAPEVLTTMLLCGAEVSAG